MDRLAAADVRAAHPRRLRYSAPVPILLIILGLALLVVGGEILVRGASRLAEAVRIPPVVIGLTVVAFGTSSPELAVAIGAALRGEPDFVTGNIIGSNIFNVLLVLGLAAVIVPLVVQRTLVRWDVPVMIAASVGLLVFALDGTLSAVEGAIFLGALAGYLAITIRFSRRRDGETGDDPGSDAEDEFEREYHGRSASAGMVLVNLALVAAGLALLVIGADRLVSGAVEVAESLGVDRLVIGLTVVALGTSAPELATSVVAAVRGEREIAVGNIVGSNIFNLLGIAGLTMLVAPGGVPVADAILRFDLPVMLAVAVACLPIFFRGHRLERWEGAVFLGYAVAYTTYLVLDATGHRALGAFSTVMLAFVIPLTVLTFMVVTVRELGWGARRRRSDGG
jgi:cation:H+ antiporter